MRLGAQEKDSIPLGESLSLAPMINTELTKHAGLVTAQRQAGIQRQSSDDHVIGG